MRKRREINVFSIAFLDILSGALGAVIILYVALPKNQPQLEPAPIVTIAETQEIGQQLQAAQASVSQLNAKLQQAQQELAQAKAAAVTTGQVERPPSIDADIGFKFKGKKIIFLIDTSYSMVQEERMGQVKGGIKMLLTNLAPDYQVDIVQFPFGERAPFKSFWGKIQPLDQANRQDAFEFVYRLRPLGGTPTREALIFIINNYSNISDIIVLSDGAPTLHNSNKKDDIQDILKVMREENKHRQIQISTIGVGSDFMRDKDNDQYKFLFQLAADHGGFFLGF